MSWDAVATTNQELCQKDEQPHAPSPATHDEARRLWEESMGRSMKLRDALDVCRQIHKLAPFQFFNGNTVAAVVKTLVDDMVQTLPSVQAQIARSTVSHYVVGAIKARELEDVFAHFNGRWSGPASPAS